MNKSAVQHLPGVTSVFNAISVRPRTTAAEVKEKVQAALERQANTDVNSIHVNTSGTAVTLTGDVSSWRVAEEAVAAAWSAPGVTDVVDKVRVTAF